MLSVFLQVIRRDLLLAMRQKSDVLNTLFFFVVVVTMVPLGIGPEPALLRDIAAGVVWVAALLAAILSLPRLFANDYADGTLEQMLLAETCPDRPRQGRRAWAPMECIDRMAARRVLVDLAMHAARGSFVRCAGQAVRR